MAHTRRFWFLAAIVLIALFAPMRPAAAAVLLNPGFESGTGNDADDWTEFNNAFREPATPRTGSFSAKLFDPFLGVTALSGIFQNQPASPGESFGALVFVRHNTGDLLVPGSRAILKLEFFNGVTQVGFVEQTILDENSPADTYLLRRVIATAPALTDTVRFTLLFEGDGIGGSGAAIFDDAVLLPEPAALSLFAAGSVLLLRRRRV